MSTAQRADIMLVELYKGELWSWVDGQAGAQEPDRQFELAAMAAERRLESI